MVACRLMSLRSLPFFSLWHNTRENTVNCNTTNCQKFYRKLLIITRTLITRMRYSRSTPAVNRMRCARYYTAHVIILKNNMRKYDMPDIRNVSR